MKGVFIMSELQQHAIHLISRLSDDNISFLIEIIQRLMPQETYAVDTHSMSESSGMQAFKRLNAARGDIKQYFPDDFDPEKELDEARAERKF